MSKFNARKNNADTVKFSREEKEALKRLAGYDADGWFNGIASAII